MSKRSKSDDDVKTVSPSMGAPGDKVLPKPAWKKYQFKSSELLWFCTPKREWYVFEHAGTSASGFPPNSRNCGPDVIATVVLGENERTLNMIQMIRLAAANRTTPSGSVEHMDEERRVGLSTNWDFDTSDLIYVFLQMGVIPIIMHYKYDVFGRASENFEINAKTKKPVKMDPKEYGAFHSGGGLAKAVIEELTKPEGAVMRHYAVLKYVLNHWVILSQRSNGEPSEYQTKYLASELPVGLFKNFTEFVMEWGAIYSD